MALAGIHVTWGYAGSKQPAQKNPKQDYGILHKPELSETMAAAATSTTVAPVADGNAGPPLCSIEAGPADVYCAIDVVPNATTGARFLVRANTREDRYCTPGDKVAFILVP